MPDVPPAEIQARLRSLPAVSAILGRPEVRALETVHGHAVVVRAVRELLDAARQSILGGGPGELGDAQIEARVALVARSSLRPVINATGVIVHTNLGRAPLAAEALQSALAMGSGYSSLEYDLEQGQRGSRHHHATELLTELTGAEDAAVVNNNAGAVLLALSALASEREVVVSRGELVEIGGGFRIPDVMRQSGARLVEVGTTNRTRLSDYEQAISEQTAVLLKVHRSNFDLVGFTAEVGLGELAALARSRGLPLIYDAGSGCLRRLSGLASETPVDEALADGVDLVTFSGDKLLGGPQAGLIVGRRDLVGQVRRHPLMRPLRPDKLCLAALRETLRLWRDTWTSVPVARMIEASPVNLQQRAQDLSARLQRLDPSLELSVVETVDRVGGGASPMVELTGWAVRVAGPSPTDLAAALRATEPPVIGHVEDDALLLHLRCVEPAADDALAQLVSAAAARAGGRHA